MKSTRLMTSEQRYEPAGKRLRVLFRPIQARQPRPVAGHQEPRGVMRSLVGVKADFSNPLPERLTTLNSNQVVIVHALTAIVTGAVLPRSARHRMC